MSSHIDAADTFLVEQRAVLREMAQVAGTDPADTVFVGDDHGHAHAANGICFTKSGNCCCARLSHTEALQHLMAAVVFLQEGINAALQFGIHRVSANRSNNQKGQIHLLSPLVDRQIFQMIRQPAEMVGLVFCEYF